MICDDFNKKLAALNAKQAEINKQRLTRELGIKDKDFTPQTLVDHLVNNEGFDRKMLEAFMSASTTTPEGKDAVRQATSRVMDQGLEMAKDLSEGDLKEKMVDAADNVRTGVREGLVRSLNTRPKNVNEASNGFMNFIGGEAQMLPIGKTASGNTAYVGRGEAAAWQRRVDSVFKETRQELGGISKIAFNESLQLIGGGRRGKDLEGDLEPYFKRIDERIAAKPILKDFKAKLQVAKDVYANPKVKQFINEYSEYLDAVGTTLSEEKIADKREGYWHNVVALEQKYADWYDRTLNGPRVNTSDFRESKKYDSLIDMIIDSPVMPATLNFSEIAGRYISNAGRAVTLRQVREKMVDNINLDDKADGRMMIKTPDGDYPMVAMRTSKGKYPELPGGETYKNLGHINEAWDGIFVHPDFYPWMNSNFGEFRKLGGIARMAINTGQILKNFTLGIGFGEFSAHGFSLSKKYMSLSASQFGKLNVGEWINPWGAASRGISKLVNHNANVRKAIQIGQMTVKQVDMLHIAAMKEVTLLNLLSGAEGLAMKALSKMGITPEDMLHPISDGLAKYSNWQHERLFNKFQLGLKCDLADRIAQTPWFEAMATKHGEDHAFQQLGKMLNDHFGGQNLEMIGRSKGLQMIMRAGLLAPDWLESKFNRIARIGLSDSPEIRKAYASSVLHYLAALGILHVVVQQVMDSVTGEKRTMEQMFKDWGNGDLGVIKVGKTKDGKHEIVSRIDFAGTEDWRPIAKLFRAMMDSVEQKSPVPALGEAAHEASYKLSPLARIPLDMMQAKKDLDKYGKRKPSSFDYPGLPIPVQQAIYSLRGGYGSTDEEKAKAVAEILAAVPLGVSVESRNVKKEKKAAK